MIEQLAAQEKYSASSVAALTIRSEAMPEFCSLVLVFASVLRSIYDNHVTNQGLPPGAGRRDYRVTL
jgi:hypothetical protein